MLEECHLCAHQCGINRNIQLGRCHCGVSPKVARAALHMWEEPCLSKKNGSGTVFFSGCNLNCIYCQNYTISQENFGKEISIEQLANTFLKLQSQNANNINLVSPTPYVPQIKEALQLAKEEGLAIPIVYNTGNYETLETIQSLDGLIDIYLPDIKYYSDEVAVRYSSAPHYFEIATSNLQEMIRQVGSVNQFDTNGILQKGIIIRHLVLPSHLTETKHILEWIKSHLPSDVTISIMMQYFPAFKAKEDTLLHRKISHKEYQLVKKMIASFQNGYIQELSDCEEEYVPPFDLSGV